MGYNNVPVNGWPQIKKLEELDALAKKIDDMPVFTSTDRAWLDEWESALPSLAQDVSDMETDKANQVQMATAEESTTASQAYSAGDYLVLDGVLYKVTDDIAQDGTIVTEGEGKNVDLATVGGELSGLNSNLTSVDISNSLTFGNDITVYMACFRKIAGMVIFNLQLGIPASSGSIPIGVIADHRPIEYDTIYAGMAYTGIDGEELPCLLYINSAGQLTLSRTNSKGYVVISGSYATN